MENIETSKSVSLPMQIRAMKQEVKYMKGLINKMVRQKRKLENLRKKHAELCNTFHTLQENT